MSVSLSQLELKKLRSTEALHYSYELLALSHHSMWPACCRIPEDNSQLVVALAACWTFIDSLHRIREIAQGAPGINSRSAEMRAFLSATTLAEEYRHYIQHLRREVANDPPSNFPVFGSLSWVDPEDPYRCNLALLGAVMDGVSYTSCVYSTSKGGWLSKVCLGVADHSFNFDVMWDAAIALKSYLLPLLTANAPVQWPPAQLPLLSTRIDPSGLHG
jgi:hypothetical protein